MADDFSIRVDHVSKAFRLPHEKNASIKGALINFHKRGYERQEVLKNVNFEIKKGEFFGIVGRNGSGKSTLLKLLAGIYVPDSGQVHVRGKLTPFIELGVGFNPELTGRENIYLNGALLGFNRKEMNAMYEDIVSFAELEKFMDQKLKNYSSGMQVRLAFSVAIRANTDILLLDEVLAVGDEAFQRKCYDYFEELRRNNKTVILVSHDMGAIERFCTRAILIEAGRIVHEGDAKEVSEAYSDLFRIPSVPETTIDAQADEDDGPKNHWGDGRLTIQEASVQIGQPKKYGSDVDIHMKVSCNASIKGRIILAYAVKDELGQKLFGAKMPTEFLANMKPGEERNLTFTFPNNLNRGRYSVDLSIYAERERVFTDAWLDCAEFETRTDGVEGYPIVVNSRLIEGESQLSKERK
jgi:ABC-2 type transport system ATP-binding protein